MIQPSNYCTRGAVIIYGRGEVQIRKSHALKSCPPSELARYIFALPRILRTKINPPPTFGLNTLTCKFIWYDSSVCLTLTLIQKLSFTVGTLMKVMVLRGMVFAT